MTPLSRSLNRLLRPRGSALVPAALLLLLLPAARPSAPAAGLSQAPVDPLRFASEIQAFLSSDRTNPPPQRGVVFVGSSSIRLWKTLPNDFPKQKVLNRGFGGSEIADSVRYFDQLVLPAKPRQIVLYAGGNDINAGKSPEQVFADFRAFVEKVQQALPRTRVCYISIAPNPARWTQVDRVRAANALIHNYTAAHRGKLAFIDVFPLMLGTNGLPKPEIFVEDRLHMNEKGYAIWREKVGPFLR